MQYGIGVGGDLHADEASQHGPDTTGEEGEGGKLGQHVPSAAEGDDQQDHEDHSEHLATVVY